MEIKTVKKMMLNREFKKIDALDSCYIQRMVQLMPKTYVKANKTNLSKLITWRKSKFNTLRKTEVIEKILTRIGENHENEFFTERYQCIVGDYNSGWDYILIMDHQLSFLVNNYCGILECHQLYTKYHPENLGWGKYKNLFRSYQWKWDSNKYPIELSVNEKFEGQGWMFKHLSFDKVIVFIRLDYEEEELRLSPDPYTFTSSVQFGFKPIHHWRQNSFYHKSNLKTLEIF